MIDSDAERYVTESAKESGLAERGPFERDRGRVLHSAGFRRLASKTQVHTAGGADFGQADTTAVGGFLRTRLTHSLEVAQIAREMGERLGCVPDVVDTAGLAHDLGHPPFGHNGEAILNEVARTCGGFEGNAQTLRVLTRLEAKTFAADGRSVGLNLTRAGLDAVCKYPWHRRPGTRKFGVYADDTAVFDWFRAGAPDGRRCLEAQVMDWADDVAYSVHDVEDGIHGGFVDLVPLRDDGAERLALCTDVASVYFSEPVDDLAAVLVELLAEPVFEPLYRYDGSHRAQAALKRMASELTGRFVAGAVSATRREHGVAPVCRYAADLVLPWNIRAQVALLKGIALRYVMRRPAAEPQYARQREMLNELVTTLARRAPETLDPVFAPLWDEAHDDDARFRVVIDQVASLTDPAAVAWHGRLCRA